MGEVEKVNRFFDKNASPRHKSRFDRRLIVVSFRTNDPPFASSIAFSRRCRVVSSFSF
jgi:hypothetical protein